MHSAKNTCATFPLPPCNPDSTGLVVTGSVGVGYDLYLYVLDGNASLGIAGAAFGVDYDSTTASGMDVLSWTRCADLEFPGGPSGSTWPAAGTGNVLTWDRTVHCQNTPAVGDEDGGVTALLGILYVYAYGDDEFAITPRTYIPAPDLSIADCAATEYDVSFPEHTGRVGFGAEPGVDPCLSGEDFDGGDDGSSQRASGDPSREINVFFKGGQVIWPAGVSTVQLEDPSWFNPELGRSLSALGITEVRRHRDANRAQRISRSRPFDLPVRDLDYERIGILTCKEGVDRARVLAALGSSPLVDYAWAVSPAAPGYMPAEEGALTTAEGNLYCDMPDSILQNVPDPPGDPLFRKQWNMENIGQCGPFMSEWDVVARPAWSKATGDPNVVLAIVSDGSVDWSHPDLAGRVTVYPESSDSEVGTAETGIAAATGGNEVLLAGVDWNCTIQFYDGLGELTPPEVAIHNAIANGADVINVGLLYGDLVEYDPIYANAIKDAFMNNILIVKAMPDNLWGSRYPNAFCRGILNVQAITCSGYAPEYVRWVWYPDLVDVTAPGGEATPGALWPVAIISLAPAGGTQWGYGTGAAAPHVAGAATLMLARARERGLELFAEDIQAILRLTARPIQWALEPQEHFGAGAIDIGAALDAIDEKYLLHKVLLSGGVPVVNEAEVVSVKFVSEPKLPLEDLVTREVLRVPVANGSVPAEVGNHCLGDAMIWGVGAGTTGYERKGNGEVVLAAGWCGPDSGVAIEEFWRMETYVYGECPDAPTPCTMETVTEWYPVDPWSVQWSYSALCSPSGATGIGGENAREPHVWVEVRPNPAESGVRFHVHAETPGECVIRVVSADGRLVAERRDSGGIAAERLVFWDLRTRGGSLVGPGVYFYSVEIGGSVATGKIVVGR